MNSQQLQTAIDKTVANISPATKSYNSDLYNISLNHAKKLMAIQVARAGLLLERKAQATCNGFCGEYECKENQSNCKRKAQEK